MHAYVGACAWGGQRPQIPLELELEVILNNEHSSCGYWELSSGSLQEQRVLSMAGPSLQPGWYVSLCGFSSCAPPSLELNICGITICLRISALFPIFLTLTCMSFLWAQISGWVSSRSVNVALCHGFQLRASTRRGLGIQRSAESG